jgi:hypothetical protein
LAGWRLAGAVAISLFASAPGVLGDANGDGVVNIIDAQQVLRFSAGLSVANRTALSAFGDVTGDGLVNVVDAQQIARYVVGLSALGRVKTPAHAARTASTEADASLLSGPDRAPASSNNLATPG